MSESKCEVHATRVNELEQRVGRLENSVDTLAASQHRRDLEAALMGQVVELLKKTIVDLEEQVNEILKDRWRIIGGLLANGAIGATSIGILLWVLERVK